MLTVEEAVADPANSAECGVPPILVTPPVVLKLSALGSSTAVPAAVTVTSPKSISLSLATETGRSTIALAVAWVDGVLAPAGVTDASSDSPAAAPKPTVLTPNIGNAGSRLTSRSFYRLG